MLEDCILVGERVALDCPRLVEVEPMPGFNTLRVMFPPGVIPGFERVYDACFDESAEAGFSVVVHQPFEALEGIPLGAAGDVPIHCGILDRLPDIFMSELVQAE